MIYNERVIRVTGNQVVGYMTVSQFAQKHDKSCGTIRYWVVAGEIDAIKIGRSYYIPEETSLPEFKSRGRVGKRFYLSGSMVDRRKIRLSTTDYKILNAMSERTGMSVRDIWKKVSDCSLNTIYNHLHSLLMVGLIKRGAC